ncbi:MAG: DNA-directed RNA polymerase subunit omega [Coriobacteriales bacterium]|jgi:DNA-directed RNA polymerase subunit omega
MSVVKPTIDELLSVTGENRFLLCEIASRRACDITDMMRNQHNRAQQLLKDVDAKDVSAYLTDEEGQVPNPLSIAFDEIAPSHDAEGHPYAGKLSFDAEELQQTLGEDIEVPAAPQDAADGAEQAADDAEGADEPADAE